MLELVAPSRFRVVVVIPVRNHTSTVSRMIDSVRHSGWRCIVVDDGSNEQCAMILDELVAQHGAALILVRLDKPMGKGAAMTAGLREAATHGYSHVAQIDAGGQYDASEIGRFVARARRHPAAVVCGYPLHDKSVSRMRLAGRFLVRLCVWAVTLSFAVRDSMCGLRIYPLKSALVVLDKEVLSQGIAFDIDLLVRLQWRRVAVLNQHTRAMPAPAQSFEERWHDALCIARALGRLVVLTLKRRLGPGRRASAASAG